MKTVFVVERRYNGTVGYKEFDTKEAAEKFLNSDKVQEDEMHGMSFRLVEKVVES